MEATLMQPNELYLLSPLAWTHAQEVLAREADMIGQDISKKKRIAFLERECERLIEVASISIPESIDAVLVDLTHTDIVKGYDELRERFKRHGFVGTTRTLRNLSRKLDGDVIDLDLGTISAGCSILADDVDFSATARRVFGPIIEKWMEHPAYASGEISFNQLAQERLLPSEKDRRSQELAKESIREILTGMDKVNLGRVRDLAYLRGRLLDVDLAEIMCKIMSSGGAANVAEIMRASAESQYNQYCDVLETTLRQRIYELGTREPTVSAFTDSADGTKSQQSNDPGPSPSLGKEAQSPLMSIPDVMAMLQSSRSTINRMLDDGSLERIKVRSRTMVSRKSVEAYLALT